MFLTDESEFFNVAKLSGTLASLILPKQKEYPLARVMPMREENVDKIEMDIAKSYPAGMTPATINGTSSPIASMKMGGGRISWSAQEWREKYVFTAKELQTVRKLGTRDEKVAASRMVLAAQVRLRVALENRFEWMRARAIQDGALTYTPQGGTGTVTITYVHPESLEPALSGNARWSQAATATPLDNLVTWMDLFSPLAYDNSMPIVMYNSTVERYLRACASIKTIFDLRFKYNNGTTAPLQAGASSLTPSPALKQIITEYVGDIGIVISDAGLNVTGDVSAAASAAATTIYCQDGDFLKRLSDDITTNTTTKLQIVSAAGGRDVQQRTATAVNTGTGAITVDALERAVPIGAQIGFSTRFLDNDKVLMFRQFVDLDSLYTGDDSPTGLDSSENPAMGNLGSIVAVNNYYDPEIAPSPGFFSKMVKTESDPPRLEVIGMATALPRIDYPELYLRATVHASS